MVFFSKKATEPPSGLNQVQKLKQERDRRLQEQRLAARALARSLPVGGLFVLLFYRDEPPALNDYHWSLYHHTTQEQGMKHHITNEMSGYWIADHSVTSGIFNSIFLVCVIRLAIIPAARFPDFEREISSLDEQLNVPGMNCRVWVLQILERLKENGMIMYDDLNEVQAEILGLGNEHRETAARNEQPRPLLTAQSCH